MIKIVVVGFGFAAKVFHLPHLTHSTHYEVVGFVSSSEASKEHSEYRHIPVYESLQQAFEISNATLYIITTPSNQHYEMVKQCIINNKDVLVEKPAFLTVAEGEELLQLAREHQSVVSVHQNRRWDGDFITVQKLLQEETLGNWKVFESRFDRFRPIVRNRWREIAGLGSGNLYDLGSHLIDQAIVLFGEPDAVYAEVMTQRENGQTDDSFFIIFHYGEKRAYLRSNSFVNYNYPRFELHGSKGSFVKYGLDNQEAQLIEGTYYEGKEKEFGLVFKEEEKQIVIEAGGYDEYFKLLAEKLIKREPVVSLEDALKVTKYIELAVISSKEGKLIKC